MYDDLIVVPSIDYSGVVNTDCGKEHHRTVSTVDFSMAVNKEHDATVTWELFTIQIKHVQSSV